MTVPTLSPVQTGAAAVTRALKEASDRTGVGFDVLYNIAKRESAFDPNAKAGTSSAAGLFQFIEQTWLGAVKEYGAKYGLAEQAASITRTADGKFVVADPAERKAVLDLRFDAGKAAALAGEVARDNAQRLEQRLGRAVDKAEIYAAHFLGVAGAAKLLSAPADATAAELLPTAAKANRPVFFDKGGARTVGEVVASIAKSMNADVPASAGTTSAPSIGELRFDHLFASAERTGSAFRAMFDQPRSATAELSPFALTVLQALDPTRIETRTRDHRA